MRTMKPVSRRTDVRLIAALLIGFVVYRIGVELIGPAVAVAVGLAAAGATWLLTAAPKVRQ